MVSVQPKTKTCPDCSGTGAILLYRTGPVGEIIMDEYVCHECDGVGVVRA